MSERRVGRRLFLGGLGAAGVGLTVTACQERGTDAAHVDGQQPVSLPDPVVRTEPPTTLRFLSEHQARTVEAMAARIIPGTPEEPGAREAGTVFYVDQLLAGHSGWPDPAYMQGPFPETYTDDEPPEDPDDDSVVWVHEDELERYGRQGPFVPQEMYPMGITRLDELAQERHDDDFVDLSEDDQDALLEAVEDGEDEDVEEIFDDLSPSDFFEMVRVHTLQGFLADPLYGGNRDMVGWRHIGFPGSRRSFSPADMLDEGYDVTPQSLLDLPPFNADRESHHHEVPIAVRTRHPQGPRD